MAWANLWTEVKAVFLFHGDTLRELPRLMWESLRQMDSWLFATAFILAMINPPMATSFSNWDGPAVAAAAWILAAYTFWSAAKLYYSKYSAIKKERDSLITFREDAHKAWVENEKYERRVVQLENEKVEITEDADRERDELRLAREEVEILKRRLDEDQGAIDVGRRHIRWSERHNALTPMRKLSEAVNAELERLRELVSRKPPGAPEPRNLFPDSMRLARALASERERRQKRSTPDEIRSEYDSVHAAKVLGLEVGLREANFDTTMLREFCKQPRDVETIRRISEALSNLSGQLDAAIRSAQEDEEWKPGDDIGGTL